MLPDSAMILFCTFVVTACVSFGPFGTVAQRYERSVPLLSQILACVLLLHRFAPDDLEIIGSPCLSLSSFLLFATPPTRRPPKSLRLPATTFFGVCHTSRMAFLCECENAKMFSATFVATNASNAGLRSLSVPMPQRE